MTKLTRKQVTAVVQHVADWVNVLQPGTSLAVKGFLGGAEFLRERREQEEERYEGSPGYLVKKATSDLELYEVFQKFKSHSSVSSNINIALRELPTEVRADRIAKLWDVVLNSWGQGSDDIFLMTAVLTGSGDILPSLPKLVDEITRRCSQALNNCEVPKARFVESMSFCLQWCGDEDLNRLKQSVQLSCYEWAKEDFERTVNFMGSRWALVNDIQIGVFDSEYSTSRRQFEVSRFIHHLRSSPLDELKSTTTEMYLSKLLWRFRSEPQLLSAAKMSLRDAVEAARNRSDYPL